MDKNTITGLLLIGAILIGYSLWMQPSDEQIAAAKQQQDSIANVQALQEAEIAEKELTLKAQEDSLRNQKPTQDPSIQAKMDSLAALQRKQAYGNFAEATEGEAEYHVIENDFVRLTLSSKGGAPVQGELIHYVTHDSMPLYLFDKETSNFNFAFWLNNNTELQSSDLYFEPVAEMMSATSAAYRLYGQSRDQYIQLTYALPKGESYMVDANIEVHNMNEVCRASEDLFELNWQISAPFHEQSREQEQQKTTVYYKMMEDEADYISESEFEKVPLEASIQWVSFKQQYFSTAIISTTGFSKLGAEVETIETDDIRYTKTMAATFGLPLSGEQDPGCAFQFYIGPNHHQTLSDLEIGLEDQIDLGWGIFGWVNQWLVIPTFNILDEYTGLSYGIIILLLTVLIKVILFPLNWKNYVSSARMRVLKPEVDEINEKMKDKDALAKQQAVMGLYRQAGVNPMAGCVPMLLQLPILYAMFQFFPASIELRQESFLWATDLSTYDSIYSWTTHIPLLSDWYGNHISLFTILMAISTFFYSKYNMDMAGSGASAQMPQMKIMIYFMPFMLLFIFNSYSSGLSYYYFSANVLSMVQQFVIKKYFINEDEIHRKIQENKKKPAKKSGFQARLEKMAKERGLQTPKK